MRLDRERLLDIQEAIEAIRRHLPEGRSSFDGNELVQNWCLRQLEIIGEAASRISETTRELQPDIPWTSMIGMRNALIHGYFSVNWNRVWTVIERDMDHLEKSVNHLLEIIP